MKVDMHKSERLEIARKIKDARKARGITQKQLAADCNIREQTMVDMEKGKNYEVNTLLAVTHYLGLKVDLTLR